jgi:hypothetical protein
MTAVSHRYEERTMNRTHLSVNAPGPVQGLVAPRHLAVIVLTSLLLLSGCASMDGKFSESESENLGPFATQTIAIVGESDFGFTERRAVYIRKYAIPGSASPEVEAFFSNAAALDRLFRGIIGYSMKIVALSESGKSQEEQIEAYADYVMSFSAESVKKMGGTPADQQALAAKIREQDKYLEALRTAQPMIDGVTEYGEILLAEIEASSGGAVASIETQVDEGSTELIQYTDLLVDKRNSLLLGLQYIYEYENGDETALQSLIDSNIIRSKKLELKKDLTEKELRKVEAHLVARLESLSAVADTIEPDWIRYRETHAEIDNIYSQVLFEIRQARLALLTWERAHRLMSSGKSDPAEWFSLSDAPGAILKLGTKAIL